MKAKCLKCYAKTLLFQKLPCYKGNWIENGPQCPFEDNMDKLLTPICRLSGMMTVTAVHDGDTISVLDITDGHKYTIRLTRIDAPELKQPYGKEARIYLENLIKDKSVRVELVQGDFHGPRIDCEVFLGDMNINDQLVRTGNAWWYEHFAPQDLNMLKCQTIAQACKYGLWKDPKPIAPWDFRALNKVKTRKA